MYLSLRKSEGRFFHVRCRFRKSPKRIFLFMFSDRYWLQLKCEHHFPFNFLSCDTVLARSNLRACFVSKWIINSNYICTRRNSSHWQRPKPKSIYSNKSVHILKGLFWYLEENFYTNRNWLKRTTKLGRIIWFATINSTMCTIVLGNWVIR